MTKEKKCPKCNKDFTGTGALSRRDNKTEICSQCGIDEAMADFFQNALVVKEDAEDSIAPGLQD